MAKLEHENETRPVVDDMGTRRDPKVSGGDVGESEDDASRPDPDQGLRPMPVVGRQVPMNRGEDFAHIVYTLLVVDKQKSVEEAALAPIPQA